MSKWCTMLLVLGVLACSKTEDQSVDGRMNKVLENLQPQFALEGQEIPTFSLTERMEYYNVPGVSIAFLDSGKVVWVGGFGKTKNDPSGSAVTENTLFQAGTMSMPLAAVAALQMNDDSLLLLDTEINKYLKTWKVDENAYYKAKPSTSRGILSHTAGFNVYSFPGYERTDSLPATAQVLIGKGNTEKVEMIRLAGPQYTYSVGGYTTLQMAMEDVDGKPFEQLMGERILNPLKMTTSTFEQPLPAQYWPVAASGHDEKGNFVKGEWNVYPEKAASGLWTTPADFGKYVGHIQGLHNFWIIYDAIITHSTNVEMLRPYSAQGHGLGPALAGKGDSARFSHRGASFGYQCGFVGLLNGQGVVIMTNSTNGGQLIGELMTAFSTQYSWGLGSTIVRDSVNIDEDLLARYVGRYQMSKNYTASVQLEDGLIKVTTEWNNDTRTYYPETRINFFELKEGINVKFVEDQTGFVNSFMLMGQYSFFRIE